MRRSVLFILSLLSVITLEAKVVLPHVFADNMVLQRESDVALWGKAKPNSKVLIQPSWTEAKTVVKSDAQGAWFTRVATPQAGGPYEISFNDGEKIKLTNILVGEVWICSGQSNMAMRMKGSIGQPINGSADIILKAKSATPIRSCNLKGRTSIEPEDDCPATWYVNDPKGVAEASAVAYFFAKYLHDVLQVPIGIIHASWGGTPIEAWMSADVLNKEFSAEMNMTPYEKGELPAKNPQFVPATLYNGMLHTLIPFTAKGFIWYQGCANRNRWEQYKRLQPAFVKMLREDWGNDKMPFYFTQIAPYQYNDPQRREAAFMMWAQAQTLDSIPYSGMAATHDLGEFACIHPASKQQVGERLAYLALENDYGVSGIDSSTPTPRSFEFQEGAAIVKFNVGPLGICSINMELEGCFELAGDDKVFYPAKAKIEKDRKSVKIFCPEVSKPMAVRYGMRNWSEPRLFNVSGIPVSPFRSDNWNE